MRALLLLVLALGCSQPRPPECTVDQDCADLAKPACGDGGGCVACTMDAHCARGFLCVDAACTAGCRSEVDRCDWPLRCHAGEGCVCEFDFSCPLLICLGQACPVQHEGCSTNADCDGGVCVPTTHAWANLCVACQSGSSAANGVDTCPAGQYCNELVPACEPGCSRSTDCDSGRCTAHACE